METRGAAGGVVRVTVDGGTLVAAFDPPTGTWQTSKLAWQS